MSGPVNFNQLFDETGPGRQDLDELAKSVAGLSKVVRALGKNLDADAPRIRAGLAAIVQNTQALRDKAAALTTSTDAEKTALAALGTQVAQLAQQQQQYQQALAGQATVRRQVTEADKAATTALKALQTELKAAYAANDTARIEKAAIAVLEYKQQTDQLSKALRGANSLLTATAGSYNRLDAETRQLGDTIRALPGGFDNTSEAAVRMKKEFADNTQRLKDFDRELNQNYREVGSYAKGILEATRALNSQKASLTGELSALKMQANATHLSADEQRKLRAEIERTEAELTKVTGELRQYGAAAGSAGKDTAGLASGAASLGQFFVASYLSVTALLGALSATFAANAKYSDQLADVRKTTGLTAEATDQLAESLKKVDTTTSLSSLLDIAKVGGQLGIAGKDIEAFTKSIDVAVIALGDDFEGGAEQIATEIGKISTVFREELGEDQAANITRIGSAVNQLGAEGAATAPFLTDVALRTGAVAANARLGLKDVLAYAATLQETGYSAETSGTALNRLFNTLSVRSKEAYAIAKLADPTLTLKQFKNLINTDFQGAITVFLRGLREGGKTTTEFNSLLGTLKLQSGEAKSVITTLAKNVELLGDKQATANEQLALGTSLAAEAAIKGDTLSGSWKRLSNEVGQFFTTGGGSKFLKGVVDFFEKGIGTNLAGRGFFATKVVEDYGKSLADNALQQRKFADGTDTLLAKFESLRQASNPKQLEELRETVLKLKDRLGETSVVLNEQTGLYELNTVAVQRSTRAARDKFTEDATALAKRLDGYEKERALANATASAIQEEADVRRRAVQEAAKVDPADANNAPLFRLELKKQESPSYFGKQTLSDETLKSYTEYVRLTGETAAATDKAALSEKKRDEVLRQLERLGLDANAAFALLSQTTKDQTTATDDSVEADKKKKRSIADVTKEEAALAKQRLEERLNDLTRQADNPANTEAVRTDALKKAAQIRIQVAANERDELIHEAALKYKNQVNGEQALGLATTRLTEAFSAKRLGIERETNKALVALHNALLDQLTGIDKLIIETELDGLDKIIANDQLSYEQRQQASVDASARRIELIQIEAATERRAAKGNAEQLRAIQLKEEKATAEELAKVRHNNADFANDELDKQYAEQQLALEKSRASGEITEREYSKKSRDLDNDYHALRQLNFKDDVTKQKEALEQEKANIKERTDFAIAEEQRLRQLKGELINEGLENVRGFSDAYFTIESNTNQALVDNLARSKEQELAVAGDNAELKAQIEENYRKRELAAKRKQAEQDKRQAEFNVVLNTAQAVTAVLSTGGGTRYADFGISAGILSGFVIAQGLAQLLAIESRPLPTYFKGRRGGPREKAIVGEQGPELMGQPGSFRLAAQQGIAQLEAGDRVYTAPETREVLREHELVAGRLVQRRQVADQEQQAHALRVVSPGYAVGAAAEARAAVAARERDTDRLIKAIQERPEVRLTEEGLREWRRKDNTWTEYVDKRYRRRG